MGGISGSVSGAASADFYKRQLEQYLEERSTGPQGPNGLSAYQVWASQQPAGNDTSMTAFLAFLGAIPGVRGSLITSEAVNPTSSSITENVSPINNDHHIDTTDPDSLELYRYNGTVWSSVVSIPTQTSLDKIYTEAALQSSYHFRHTTPTGLSDKGFFLNQVASTDEQYCSVPTNAHESNTHISALADYDLELAVAVISIKGASQGIGANDNTNPMILNLVLHSWQGSSVQTETSFSVTIPRASNGINGPIGGTDGSSSLNSDIRALIQIPSGIKIPMGYLFGLEFKTPGSPVAGTLADIDNTNIKLVFKRDPTSTLPLISY